MGLVLVSNHFLGSDLCFRIRADSCRPAYNSVFYCNNSLHQTAAKISFPVVVLLCKIFCLASLRMAARTYMLLRLHRKRSRLLYNNFNAVIYGSIHSCVTTFNIEVCRQIHSEFYGYSQGCKSLLSIGGDNLQFYPNVSLFSTLGGINLDHDFFHVSKLSEDQKKNFFLQIQVKSKKKVFTKNRTLFSPNSSGNLGSDAHRSQIIGGYANEDHTQIIGGDTAKLLGGISAPLGIACLASV